MPIVYGPALVLLVVVITLRSFHVTSRVAPLFSVNGEVYQISGLYHNLWAILG